MGQVVDETVLREVLGDAFPDQPDDLLESTTASAAAIGEAVVDAQDFASLDWVRDVHRTFAEVCDAAYASESVSPVACKKGCWWCCTVKVVCTVPEVLVLAEHLRQTLDSEALDAICQRVAAAADNARRFPSPADRPRHDCPMLVNTACSVHPVRPLVCRGVTSLDAGPCENEFRVNQGGGDIEASVRYEPLLHVIASGFGLGLSVGCAALELDHGLVDMHVALEVAMTEPMSLARWMAGEALFEEARSIAGVD